MIEKIEEKKKENEEKGDYSTNKSNIIYPHCPKLQAQQAHCRKSVIQPTLTAGCHRAANVMKFSCVMKGSREANRTVVIRGC